METSVKEKIIAKDSLSSYTWANKNELQLMGPGKEQRTFSVLTGI